ncbi:MAG TPA: hypothetical protein VM165_11040 [Planctomycetaceae bacterium]|nr:hypothetical protein [Planctomycetaceae bacterium]
MSHSIGVETPLGSPAGVRLSRQPVSSPGSGRCPGGPFAPAGGDVFGGPLASARG